MAELWEENDKKKTLRNYWTKQIGRALRTYSSQASGVWATETISQAWLKFQAIFAWIIIALNIESIFCHRVLTSAQTFQGVLGRRVAAHPLFPHRRISNVVIAKCKINGCLAVVNHRHEYLDVALDGFPNCRDMSVRLWYHKGQDRSVNTWKWIGRRGRQQVARFLSSSDFYKIYFVCIQHCMNAQIQQPKTSIVSLFT